SEARGRGLFCFLEVEAARHPAEPHFLIDLARARGIVFLEKPKKLGAVAGIECLEPGGKPVRGRCIRELRLRRRAQKRRRKQGNSHQSATHLDRKSTRLNSSHVA